MEREVDEEGPGVVVDEGELADKLPTRLNL